MKILDVSRAIAKLDKDIATLQYCLDFLDLMDLGISDVVNMDGAFTGEGGKAIIANHTELQLPTIRAFRAHINTAIEKNEKMKEYILGFEPTENGVVTEDYWDTQMNRGLDKVEESIEQSKQNVDDCTASVGHIISLGKLNITQVLNRIDSSRKFAGEVVDGLHTLDSDGVDLMSEVQASSAEMNGILEKAIEWTNSGGPLLKGVNLQDVKSHFEEATLHKEAPDVDMGRLNRDSGDEPSLMQNVMSFLGQDFKTAYDWTLVGKDGARGAATAIIFMSNTLKLEPTGTGASKLVINEAWQAKNGRFDSKVATQLRKSFNNPKNYFSRYGYTPSHLLKDVAGLNNVQSAGMAKLLERSAGSRLSYIDGQRLVNYYRKGDKWGNLRNLGKNVYHNFKPTMRSFDMKNSFNKLKNDAKRPLNKIRNFDPKSSLNKLKDIDPKKALNNAKKSLKPGNKGFGKNLARGANVLSVGLNFMEAFSDEHKDKSTGQRTGRAIAGSALDIGAGAAGAAAGAAIGTMIFPGVGTVVGGFIGAAAAGIGANTLLGEPVRQAGEKIGAAAEKAGKAVVDTAKKATKAVSNAVDNVKEGAKNLLSGGAKALGSLFG
ncbi:T7SS effector LXG polymorphic toxin [Shouchella lonarensis]|uniref:LXG domain of WXG superfamily protein n=1 Tax=Shouchella lonarensis TaxID=1464122 RepID=A0A1G6GY73_9BACI|nr:T7SS effector LXG polymorphic toxin [Shouchella lonarensis]SDB86982.1 LXG domain of WXG superfamily protein [Shouchella lonarensis]